MSEITEDGGTTFLQNFEQIKHATRCKIQEMTIIWTAT